MVEIEKAQHTELQRRIGIPIWLSFRDSNDIYEMYHYFHDQKGNEKSYSIEDVSTPGNAPGHVTLLSDIVIECQNRAREIQRRIKCIRNIIPKIVVLSLAWCFDPVSLREICRIKLFLLLLVSSCLFSSKDRISGQCTDLNWTPTHSTQTPIAIHIEADQPKHSDIE